MEKKQWIARTLASLEGAQRAEAPTDLAEKTIQRLGWREVETRVPAGVRFHLVPRIAWRMAACAAFLLAINVVTCLYFEKSDRPSQTFAQEYFAFTPTISL